LGRKAVSASTMGRAATAARSASRVLKERQDVGRSAETVEAIEQQLAELNQQFAAEAGQGDGTASAVSDPLEPLVVKLKKTNNTVSACALCWAPFWQPAGG